MSLFIVIGSTERPEPELDNRTLYERLKEQKDRKQEEWSEQFKVSECIVVLCMARAVIEH